MSELLRTRVGPRRRFLALALVAAVLPVVAAAAQTAPCTANPTPQTPGAVFLACQLDALPVPQLDRQRVGGSGHRACANVAMWIVIDSEGSAAPEPGRAHESIDAACRDVVSQWRFRAGRRDDSPVATRMQVRLLYGERRPRDVLWDPIIQLRAANDTLFDLLVEWRAPDPTAFVPLSAAAEDSAMAAVIAAITRRGFTDRLDHVCFDFGDERARTQRIVNLTNDLSRPLHPRDDCPSIRYVRPGVVRYVADLPYLHVGVRGVVRAAVDAVVVDAWYARGLGGAGFWCRARRAAPAWRASCVRLWSA